VDVWVQLKGPGFDKRCYGFWDGGLVLPVFPDGSNLTERDWAVKIIESSYL